MRGGVVDFVKDALFPYFCPECRREGEWWCAECRKKSYNFQKIRAVNDLDLVTALFLFNEPAPIGKLIHDFKYNFMIDIGQLWKDVVADNMFSLSKTTLVPVPLYKRRERERGYNQSVIIANMLAEHFKLKVDDGLLRRIRSTKQQAKLGAEERRKNVDGAFVWVGSTVPEHVTLVDDVYTTGSTMNECAKVLRAAGVKNVEGFVLAHG
jgi:ComF family protein